jgi:ribosomal-protein-alanine N-acetyltransferase
MAPRLQTGSSIFLRHVTRQDETEFLKAALASTGFHQSWIRLPTDPQRFSDYLARFDQVTAYGFVLCRIGDGAIVGMVNLSQIVRGSYQRGLLGYGTFAGNQGRGHMTEGLRLVMRHAFGDLGLHRLEAEIQPGNTDSLRLVERLGFWREGLARGLINIGGVWRDHERWAITSDRWTG